MICVDNTGDVTPGAIPTMPGAVCRPSTTPSTAAPCLADPTSPGLMLGRTGVDPGEILVTEQPVLLDITEPDPDPSTRAHAGVTPIPVGCRIEVILIAKKWIQSTRVHDRPGLHGWLCRYASPISGSLLSRSTSSSMASGSALQSSRQNDVRLCSGGNSLSNARFSAARSSSGPTVWIARAASISGCSSSSAARPR